MAPQLPGPTDSVLSDPMLNRALANRLFRAKTETIEDQPAFEIFRTGDRQSGQVVWVP
jgi:hypothetical protein